MNSKSWKCLLIPSVLTQITKFLCFKTSSEKYTVILVTVCILKLHLVKNLLMAAEHFLLTSHTHHTMYTKIYKNSDTHALPRHLVYVTLIQRRYVYHCTIDCLCNTKLRHYHKRSIAKINSSALRHWGKETFMLSKRNVCFCGVLGAYLHGPVLLRPKWNTTRE